MNKIIATYNDEKIITRLVDNDESLIQELIDNDEKYKIFDNSLQLQIGESIDCYDDIGNTFPNSILQEKGLLKLNDDEVLDGEEIREKTEIEKYNDSPNSEINITKVIDTDEQGNNYLREKNMLEKYNDDPNSETNITKVIDTDEQGNKYIREKSMLEKYNDAFISKDDYNAWAIDQRANEYSYTTDKMNARLMYDTGLSESEKTDLQNEIEVTKIKIKEKYAKV